MVDVSEGRSYAFDFDAYDGDKTKNSLRQHNFNRLKHYNTLVTIHNVAVKTPSREAADEMEEVYEKYKRSVAACEAANHRLLDLDKEYEKEWDKNCAALVKERKEADRCALTVFGTGRPVAAAQARGKDQVCKPNDALRPDLLTTKTAPGVLVRWKDRYRAYYISSKMHLATNEEQHQYLYACLDDEVYQRIRYKVDPKASPVFLDPQSQYKAVMDVLSEEFVGLYPLTMRRLEWLSHKYAGSWSAYYSQMKTLAIAAEYRQMKADDFFAFSLIANIPHGEMRSEMLRKNAPTPQELDEIGRQYDRAGAVQAHMSASGTPKALTAKQGEGKKKKGGAAGGESTGFRKWKQLEAQGKCGRCASADHVSADCPNKKSKCSVCQKTGHTARACQQAPSAKQVENKDSTPTLPMLGYEGNSETTAKAKTARAAAVIGKPKSRSTPPLGL